MSKKVKEPEPFVLMVSGCEDSIAYNPPPLISSSLEYLESLIAEDQVDEYHQGVVYAITEVLSCPAMLLQERVEDLLEEIIDELTDDDKDEEQEEPEGEEDMSKKNKQVGFIERKQDDIARAVNTNKAGEVANLPPDDDISDDDLIAEFRNQAEPSTRFMDM